MDKKITVGDLVIVTACPSPWMGFVISPSPDGEIANVACWCGGDSIYGEKSVRWDLDFYSYSVGTLIKTGVSNKTKTNEILKSMGYQPL